MQKMDPILSIKDLEIFIDDDYGTKRIVNTINFDINQGETLGIVGESGCGKSITALSIMRLLHTPPVRIKGSIRFCGQELLELSKRDMQAIRGNKISMIFQEPMTSLNPVFTVGQQLMEVFMLHQGMSRRDALARSVDALRLVNVANPEKRIKDYPFQLSGGMRQRVMIAMALACKPALLIADEPTTALDVTIQAQVLDLMRKLKDEMGTSIAFITHDLGVVNEMCDRVIVLYCGEILEEAPVKELFHNPVHPYTRGLLNALPHIGSKTDKLYVIPGMVPPAGKFPSGCVFAPRCAHAQQRCLEAQPPMTSCGEGHTVRCIMAGRKES